MCGRFVLNSTPAEIADRFELEEMPEWSPRYNIAPTQRIPIIRVSDGTRECTLARWGLIPAWSKEPKTEYSTFNARAESVAVKPAFREAFRQRRCLIPTDGFFEWSRTENSKTPYFISLKEPGPFAFAGLWERWEQEGQIVESCTIIVTEPNALMKNIHDRMPVILAAEDYNLWLDADRNDIVGIQALLKPCPTECMQAYPVGTAVNSVRNDSEALILPVSPPTVPTQTSLF